MSFKTEEEFIVELLKNKNIELVEMAYEEKKISASELQEIFCEIDDWEFHKLVHKEREYCIVGYSNAKEKYITIIVREKDTTYKGFVHYFLLGELWDFEQFCSFFQGKKIFPSCIETYVNGAQVYSKRFPTDSDICVESERIFIKSQVAPHSLYSEEIDYVHYVGSVIPTKAYATEELIKIYYHNGKYSDFYITIY